MLGLPSANGLSGESVELGRFVIGEPLGVNWRDEWATFDVSVDTKGKDISAGQLPLLETRGKAKKDGGNEENAVSAQFHGKGKLLEESQILEGQVRPRVLASIGLDKGGSTYIIVMVFAGWLRLLEIVLRWGARAQSAKTGEKSEFSFVWTA